MTDTRLWMQIKGETCEDTGGEYYNRYYFQRGVRGLTVRQQYIGRAAVSGADALTRADDELSVAEKGRIAPETLYAAAASVLRVCLRHGGPVIEVVENIIAVPPNAHKLVIRGGGMIPTQEDVDGVIRHLSSPDKHDGLYRYTDRGMVSAAYLPHEDYSGIKLDHDGVMMYRGGHTGAALFGLLGGENLIERPVAPDTRPDY